MIKTGLIKSLSKKSNKSEPYIESIWIEISNQLISEGINDNSKRFYPYLLIRLKKKLKINESNQVLKKFKEFIEEK